MPLSLGHFTKELTALAGKMPLKYTDKKFLITESQTHFDHICISLSYVQKAYIPQTPAYIKLILQQQEAPTEERNLSGPLNSTSKSKKILEYSCLSLPLSPFATKMPNNLITSG